MTGNGETGLVVSGARVVSPGRDWGVVPVRIEKGRIAATGPAHQKAAVESVHFPLWTYNPTTGKLKLDSQDKSDTVSFAKNAVSKELGENRFK